MAKTWYPVVDYLNCEECGTCVNMCPHGVYDTAKSPSPVVMNPLECVDHCHGCGNRCPAGAITYVGDNTGWTPPNGTQQITEACCSGGCSEPAEKRVLVEYLYLDLKVCDRCIGTDNVLDEVMAALSPVLELAGYVVTYNKIEMTTAEIATQYKFLSSPTIRVNGRDICTSVEENSCGCCSDLSGTDVDCRVFSYNGESYEVPPSEMVAEAVLKAVFGPDEIGMPEDYEMPENITSFFKGKKNKSGCSCADGCCS